MKDFQVILNKYNKWKKWRKIRHLFMFGLVCYMFGIISGLVWSYMQSH